MSLNMKITKLIFFAIFFIVLIPTTALAGKLYKWVDKNGVVHVTDDPENVPEEHRSSVKKGLHENKLDRSVAKVKEIWKHTDSKKNLIGMGVALFVIGLLAYKLVLYTKPKLQERRRAKQLRALELSGIDNMNAVEYTNYIGKLLAHRGFKVIPPEGDLNLGVDLIIEKNKNKYAVQLKQQSSQVSKPVVIAIDREKHRYDCNSAMIITNNHFSEDAAELGKSKGCVLVDRDTLAGWIRNFKKKE
jgi:restriction system protein